MIKQDRTTQKLETIKLELSCEIAARQIKPDFSDRDIVQIKLWLLEFVSVEPPEIEFKQSAGTQYRFVTFGDGGFGDSPVSRSPGHVRFHVGNLFKSAVTLIVATGVEPWAIPFVLMRAFVDLAQSTAVKLTEVEACVAWVLWHVDEFKKSSEIPELLDVVNEHRKSHGRSDISVNILTDALQKLEKLGFIRIHSQEPLIYTLESFVTYKYDK